jgi:hypothetical protein
MNSGPKARFIPAWAKHGFSAVDLLALRGVAPRSAAQRLHGTGKSVPSAGRGRVRRSATNATAKHVLGQRPRLLDRNNDEG